MQYMFAVVCTLGQLGYDVPARLYRGLLQIFVDERPNPAA